MMNRALQAACVLLAAAICGRSEQKAPAPKAPMARPANRPAPKAVPRIGPPLSNPASPAAQLYRATPEQRERALEKLPPALQENIRKNLAWFDALPPDQQELVLRRHERFAALPPEKQRAFRLQMQALAKLPPDRQTEIRVALRRLQTVPVERRAEIVDSEAFRSMFNAEEQKILADLSAVMLPPI